MEIYRVSIVPSNILETHWSSSLHGKNAIFLLARPQAQGSADRFVIHFGSVHEANALQVSLFRFALYDCRLVLASFTLFLVICRLCPDLGHDLVSNIGDSPRTRSLILRHRFLGSRSRPTDWKSRWIVLSRIIREPAKSSSDSQ